LEPRRGAKAGQADQDQGLPQELQGEAVPYVVVHSRRTEWIVSNDLLSRDSAHEAREVRGVRWKIEEFHREAKQ
jgi:hypothetical protein